MTESIALLPKKHKKGTFQGNSIYFDNRSIAAGCTPPAVEALGRVVGGTTIGPPSGGVRPSTGLLRRFAPRNDDAACHCARHPPSLRA
ncbi:MAG: hypothetical protein LBT00_14285 [Spirochaetaceae bacterium]|nr:hypothetical protein [Spirochaetaceae bacterium]